MTPHELYTSLVAKVKVMNYNYLSIGKTLRDLKDGDKFRESVGDIDTWQQFVKQPEVSMTVGEANKLIELYEVYVEQLGFDEETLSGYPMKNLKTLLHYAKDLQDYGEMANVDNFDTLFYQAKTLSDRDFKDALIETEESLEEVPRTYKYVVMKICNETKNMSRVHEVTDEVKSKL